MMELLHHIGVWSLAGSHDLLPQARMSLAQCRPLLQIPPLFSLVFITLIFTMALLCARNYIKAEKEIALLFIHLLTDLLTLSVDVLGMF